MRRISFLATFLALLPFLTTPSLSDPYQVVFEEVGSVATSVSYLHIAIDLKLPLLRQAIKDYHALATSAFTSINLNRPDVNRYFLSKLPPEANIRPNSSLLLMWEPIFKDFQTDFASLRAQFGTRASTFLKRFDHLTSILPHTATTDPYTHVADDVRFRRSLRVKRYIPLVIAKGVVGTLLGLYNRHKLNILRKDLNTVIADQKRLLVTQYSHSSALANLNASYSYMPTMFREMNLMAPTKLLVRLLEIELTIEGELAKITSAVQAAQLRRLSISLLSGEKLNQALSLAKSRAAAQRLELLVEHPSDLFQIEASYFFDGSEISLLLHVPMAAKNSVLRLLRFLPFPLSFTNQHFLLPNPKKKLYAISSNEPRVSVELDEADLEGCYRVNSIHLCEKLGVLHRRTERLCLGALYSQNFERAMQLCDVDVVPPSERVLQMSHNRYLVYSTKSKTATVMCRNHSSSEYHLKVGVNQLHVSPSCYVELQDHVIFADSALAGDNQIREIAWDPSELQMDAVELADAEEAIATAAEDGMTSSTLADVRRRTGSRRRWIRWPLFLALMIVVIIIGLVAWAFMFLSTHKFWLLKQSVKVIHDQVTSAVSRFVHNRLHRSVPPPPPETSLPAPPPHSSHHPPSTDSGLDSIRPDPTAPNEIVLYDPVPEVETLRRRRRRRRDRYRLPSFIPRRWTSFGPRETARFLGATHHLEPIR